MTDIDWTNPYGPPIYPAVEKLDRKGHRAADCAVCDGKPAETRIANYSAAWHDGDVICAKPGCMRYVRDWDAG